MPESNWSVQQGYRMRLETDADFVYRGEAITGQVRAESNSARAITVPKASVWLWSGGLDDSGNYITPRQDVFGDLELPPRETRTVGFSLPVKGFGFVLGTTNLSLTAGNPMSALFKHLTLPIRVLPERRFVELAAHLAKVSKHEVSYWTVAGAGDGVEAHLVPRPEMRPLFDGLGLELYPDGTSVYGRLIVDPQERTLADVLRAATLADVRRYRIRFTAGELFSAGEEFERLLRPFMASDRHLPIPTTGTERDELPRASQAPAPDPEGLPVPDAPPVETER